MKVEEIMLALANDEDKIREGKWKHLVIEESFGDFRDNVQGQNMVMFGIASAEPPRVVLTCASWFTSVFH